MPPNTRRMSEEVAGPPSPTPSLIDVKAETRLVLKSFLRHALSVAPGDRPGRIGGEYYDPHKFSATVREKQKKEESGWDSLDEKISLAEEKKHGIKNLIKRRLKPRPFTTRNSKKDASTDPALNGSLEKNRPVVLAHKGSGASSLVQIRAEEAKSSASEDEGDRKVDDKKKKKNKLKLPELFRKKKADVRPVRPGSLPIDKNAQPGKTIQSPSHPPKFYDGVAEKLDRIAQRTVKRKSPTKPEPTELNEPKENNKENKEAIIQQLVQLLTMEGDAINDKIEANPFLRSSLKRLSYPSFAKLLDTCANESIDPPLPAPESPTLRRVAITMEMTRRVVTATGVMQRVEGFAERYMENFAPWVKSHGGWESIVQMEPQEFD